MKWWYNMFSHTLECNEAETKSVGLYNPIFFSMEKKFEIIFWQRIEYSQ